MKRLLTIVAIFMTMICGSIFLVSCSNNYKKMSLVVEYCVSTKDDDGKWVVGEWTTIENGEFDYYLSDSNSKRLHVRIKVKGTSKKVDSLYISQSSSSSIIPETRTVKPNEAFELLVNTIGRAEFTITPSQGGEDKAVSFGVNVYRELSGISQNSECVPAAVIGGYVRLEDLENLITYQPVGETNQTGVDFSLVGIGTLVNDGNTNLIERTFVESSDYMIVGDGNEIRHRNDSNKSVKLDTSRGFLMLDVSYGYTLTTNNNVVKLQATSKYNKGIVTDVYVYIVENFKSDSLLVSYSPNVQLENGVVPTDPDKAMPVPDSPENVVIYNVSIDNEGYKEYNHIEVYTYTNASIYSYEGNPGIDLRVYVNDERYYYDFDKEDDLSESDKLSKYQYQLRKFGIQVSPITIEEYGVIKLVGLKFETNPTSMSTADTYNIRLELDFTAFDFTASGKIPANELRKEFVINVQNLASGFSINGKSYNGNLDKITQVTSNEVSTITGYDATTPAKLYTSYSQESIGMPINIQAIPNNAINSEVYVGLYDSCAYNAETKTLITGNNLAIGNNNDVAKLQLLQSANNNIPMLGGEYVINFNNKNKITYLTFNEMADISGIKQIFIVCRVQCTPDSFGTQTSIMPEFITFVAKIKVVGSINDVWVYKNLEETNNYDTLTDTYLATATSIRSYINFSSIAGDVDYSEITITSLNGNIKFSTNGTEWKDAITADQLSTQTSNGTTLHNLYFRTENECSDSLVISSSNGIGKQLDYQFVNVVNNVDSVKIDYDSTYIKTFTTTDGNNNVIDWVDKVGIDGITEAGAVDLRYLALKSGETVQFMAFGDDTTNTIKSIKATSLKSGDVEYGKIVKNGVGLYTAVNALPTFNSGAILEPSDDNKFFFDVKANSTGFTSILLVEVNFYAKNTITDKIEPQTKYFLYEVAVYTPASKLSVGAKDGKDKIIYINENYPEAAEVTFNIGLNSATRQILFSSSELNNQINLSYGMDSGTSIYGIGFNLSDNFINAEEYFEVTGYNVVTEGRLNGNFFVDNNVRQLRVNAVKSLKPLQDNGMKSIDFDVVIYQFGEEIGTTKEKVIIYFDDYNVSETIVVSSGVDGYNNVYLNLADATKSYKNIVAYATNSLGDVTYKELGYRIYQIDSTTKLKTPYLGNDLVVTYDERSNNFKIEAKNKGGLYQLELYAKDGGGEPHQINVTVSDGESEETAYLISTLDEFMSLKGDSTEGKFYRLSQDIDISALKEKGWWSNSTEFKGTLDGAMTIDDPQTDTTIYRRYSLMNLSITNDSFKNMSDANCFGLFSIVSGTIKNVIFTNAKINISLLGGEVEGANTSNSPVNIGIIAGINSGVIENCSVNIGNSVITFTNSASNTTYNIGLVAGLNKGASKDNGKIIYNNTITGSNYSRLVDVGNNANKFTINIEKGNGSFADNTKIYIGGVVGQNASDSTISTDYLDKSSNNIKNEIKAVVNIEVNVEYDASNAPMNINALNVGGIAGLNEGNITNIAVSGSIVANDKANLGGVAGENTGSIQEVANYGTYIKGGILINGYKDINNKTLVYHSYDDANANTINQEQNVGGIVGYNNAGVVDNVRIMFITLTADEVSVEYARALIQGVGNVAGIIGKATNTQLTRAYVENFVEDGDNSLNYNIIGTNGANVAGLIADSNTSGATLSFVQADFNVEGCTFYEFGEGLTYEYVYFIGDVLSSDATAEKASSHNIIIEGKSYIIKNVVKVENGTDAETGEPITTITKTITEFGVDKIEIGQEPDINGGDVIYWLQSDEEGVNSNQPYLRYIKDNVRYHTLTIRPTEIIVNVDQNYFDENANFEMKNEAVKYEEGIYIQYVDNNSTTDNSEDDRIVATAIVYYVEGGNNTYKLVSDDADKGLIEMAVLPNIDGVDGDYNVGIISGSSVATLTDGGSTITFNGVGRVELKFVSVFDRSKTDVVVIFVENPLDDNVFNISASAGITDVNKDSVNYTARVNTNSILSLGLIAINGQVFDSTKTYMSATYSTGTALQTITEKDDTTGEDKLKTQRVQGIDITNYFSINALTEEIYTGAGKYKLGQFNVVTKSLDNSYSYLEIPVTINVYLNLKEYYIDGISLSDLFNQEILLATRTITITIYNKPTDLSVSSNVKAESGEDVDIVAKLTTGYVNPNGISSSISIDRSNIIGGQGNKVILNIVGQDTIDLVLTAGNENATKLLEQAKLNSGIANFSIWDLFDTVVTYELFPDKTNPLGYTYRINIRLKDEYRNLSLEGLTEREWIFNLNITATENVNLTQDVVVSFVPQQLISLRLENYSHLVASVGGGNAETEAEFVSSQTESSLIVPGESGLIKIFADYSYSYFENISITSSVQMIDGNEYFIRFQQMVYNQTTGKYESYAGITAEGQTLNLKKVSYKENGTYYYDGILFVRTILDEFVGESKIFTMTVNATTYNLDGNTIDISRTKTVISQYRPGVYMSVENALAQTIDIDGVGKQVYLVEKDSSVTAIVARVYGYELNIQPTITVKDMDGEIIDDVDNVAVVQKGNITIDSTGAYIIRYTLAVNTLTKFKVTMKMTLLDNGNSLLDTEKELIFYPVEYVVKDVYVQGEANGGLDIAVHSSRALELVFNTYSTTTDKRNDIISEIKKLNYLQLFYVNQINSSGQDYEKTFDEYLDKTDTNFTIKKSTNGTYFIEALKKVSPMVVYFNVWYGYNLETGEVMFSAERTEDCNQLLSHNFRLILTMETSEDAPQLIYTVEELMAMAEGENYILMDDLTLENWVPLNTAIASLDGNGKQINIVSFNIPVEASVNAGLFGVVSENTILKNIVINIGTMKNNLDTTSHTVYVRDDNVANATVNFGLLAGVNYGLIYNCEVLSINTIKTVELVTGYNYKLTFGALVGVNDGNITNSRVGTEYFEQLTRVNGVVNSSIIECGRIAFKAQGIVAGFVGQNNSNCTISSSFVANTSIENTAVGSSDVNRTAGFVATNSGTIAYSYVKGLERNIVTTKSTTNSLTGGSECVILASGNGDVAGFAYLNDGTIHDCYSNTICKSTSSGAAGFVYNTLNGKVYQCYSATKVESGNTNTALATELPFVGVGVDKAEAQQLLSNKDMLNCYYLDDGTEYDTNYRLAEDAVEPKGLTLENFATSSNLNNFSFISDTTSEQQLNGVWTYSTAVDRNRSTYPLSYVALPELTSANTIARSLRYFPTDDEWVNAGYDIAEDKHVLGVEEYSLGSKNNPHIIRNIDEYRSVFVNEDRKVNGYHYMVGYVRFVDNISFGIGNNDYLNVETRTEYILGDKNEDGKSQPSFTVIDGNGMTISDVVINHTANEQGKLGLFSEVYNSVIKGLNIEYKSLTRTNSNGVTENLVGSSIASYVGGVAGTADNTYLIDLNLTGNIILRARNVVGGVVGKITGSNSGLYNITSNLSAQAGEFVTEVLNSMEYSKNVDDIVLSYAGGIAGIVDIGHSQNSGSNFNLNKLTVNNASIRADRAGGIAGYLSQNTNANRLTYTISNQSQVFGNAVAGAIVADNYATIQLSQANNESIDTQYQYDRQFAEYIKDSQIVSINNANGEYGNLVVVTGDGIVGGFAGINNGGKISNSLTKANIGNNDQLGDGIDIAGGFIGKAYGGDLQYVYAQNYIDLKHTMIDEDMGSHNYITQIAGGIIGYAAYNGTNSLKIGLDNVVSATWFDKEELTQIQTSQIVDYLVGQKDANITFHKKSSESGSPIVNYGIFNVGDNTLIADKIGNENIVLAQDYQMEDLYYIGTEGDESGGSTQQDVFNTLFAIWPEDYWRKEYTKFMPNLKLDNATGYIKISKAEDIALMEQMPDRNFILVDYVDVTVTDSNYVVNTEFKGVLIAGIDEDSNNYYQFNITLSADSSRDVGAGFFKQTTGARIANIGFNYRKAQGVNGLLLEGSTPYSAVGGVSARDTGSRFEQVVVTTEGENKIYTTGVSVANLGSIVGDGYRSKIISCTSNVNYDITTATNGAIGGLIGSSMGYNEETDEQGNIINAYDGLITSSQYHGSMKIQSPTGTDVGGIAGHAEYTRISDCGVMKEITNDNKEKSYDTLQIEIKSSNGNNNIGGIVGSYNNCSIAYSSTNVKVTDKEKVNNTGVITDNESNAPDTDVTYNVGGIVGLIKSSQGNAGIDNSYATLTYDLVQANNAFIGGIVGTQESSSSVNLDTSVSQVNVTTEMEGTANIGENIVGKIVLGGIVGWTDGNSNNNEPYYSTIINNAMSIINADVVYNNALYGGGLIGQATGSYYINNSTATGYIWANNESGTHFVDKTTTLTVLGGLVGLVGNETDRLINNANFNAYQAIKYSYTTLTLSTANVFQGNVGEGEDVVSHTIYTNGVVGYSTNKQAITIEGVLYSSDYTLALEEGNLNGNKFSAEPQNVTANILVNNNETLKPKATELQDEEINGYIGEAWLWSDTNAQLPLPLAVVDILVNMEILEHPDEGRTKVAMKTIHLGKSYSPIIISSTDDLNKENAFNQTDKGFNNYSYYLLRVGNEINIEKSRGILNGVLLGNDQEFNIEVNLFSEISRHSAVSNITFKLVDGFNGPSAVAETNNGTVFMVGVQYDDATLEGGIVATNNGTISYCYNIGNSLSGNGAGLANENNASIVNSYFTGSFNAGSSGYGLVNINSGYIANSYSAGMAKVVIGENNDGRYSNVKYDYYSNYVSTGEYEKLKGLGILGLSTRILQAVENIADSTQFNGWKVYSMHNWDNVNGNTNEDVYSTYNYGYPIHKINQLTFTNSKVERVPIRVKQTGNGAFVEIINANGENIINEDDALKLLKGKLVKDETSSKYYDNFSFLINNLGVLDLINTIKDTTGKYFELEINMNMPNDAKPGVYQEDENKLLSGWKGIGTANNPFMGVFTTSGGASDESNAQQGADETNKNSIKYILDTTLMSDEGEDEIKFATSALVMKNDEPKTITNLTGGALFNSIGNGAFIANVNLKNSQVSTSTLVNTVRAGGVATIYKVKIVENVIANGAGISGLVYGVEDGATLHIHSLDNEGITIKSYNELTGINASTMAGVIYTNNGIVNIKESFTSNEVTFEATTSTSVAGVIYNNNGTINTFTSFDSNTFTIKSSEGKTGSSATPSEIAGVVNSNTKLIDIKESFNTIKLVIESINGRHVAGFAYKNSADATILLENSIELKITSQAQGEDSKQSNVKSMSGFANTNYGTITSGDGENGSDAGNSKIELNSIGNKDTIFIAGLVGYMYGGLIAGFDISFNAGNGGEDAFVAGMVGGVVAYFYNGQLGIGQSDDANATGNETGEKSIKVSLTTATTDIFGGVAAIVGTSAGNTSTSAINPSIANVEIDQTSEEITIKGSSENADSKAYGLIVGKYLISLDEINYKLSKEITFVVRNGINVGAIIGYAENGIFNFTNECPNVVTVKGFGNVGGFIGRYAGSTGLTFKGNVENAWAIGGKEGATEFAKVEFAELGKSSNSYSASAILAENFGGLIGYWDTEVELSLIASIDNEDGGNTARAGANTGDEIFIVNPNSVLTSDAESQLKNIAKSNGEYDIVISNIGGVVGKTRTTKIVGVKNEGAVGVEYDINTDDLGGINPIAGTTINEIDSISTKINEIMQFMYVGGIAGYAQSSLNSIVEVRNCVNEASIYGMYAVGGLIGGYIDNISILIEETDSELFNKNTSDVIILGLADVGGVIGRASNLSFKGYVEGEGDDEVIKTILSFNKIIGIVNVGGVVGNLTNGDISQVVIGEAEEYATIMGNLNVGGIIGFAQNSTLNAKLIEKAEIINTNVYGTVFDYRYKEKDLNAQNLYNAYYYLPTNIGGVVGQVVEPVAFMNVTTQAYVRTDEHFKTGGTNEQDTTECTVNMTFNHIGKTGNNTSKAYYSSSNMFITYLEAYYSENSTRTRYDALESGIGGFAGSLAGKKEGNEYRYVPTFYSCSVAGDVYAYYGINVGGTIGYLGCDPQRVPLPNFSTEGGINVAGKIFVGGYIGKTLGFGSSQGYQFFGTYLNKVIEVNVQQYVETEDKDEDGNLDEVLSGSCIGGIIGCVVGNVYNIKLTDANGLNDDGTSKIKVFNSNGSRMDSSYVGALIGRMDGNEMKGCEIDYQLCDAAKYVAEDYYYSTYDEGFGTHTYKQSGIIQSPNIYNYGGLVGLCDAPEGSKGDNALTISGKHYYAFTVDTVQNRDYEQGESQYSYSSSPDVLSANAHYINTSDISISPSLLNDLYNSDEDNHNPTDVNAKGWAKEYTLFRTLARVIDQPGEETGDSVQVIYSADYITGVQTKYKLDDKLWISDEIIYTIYQPIGQTARLYCKYGIAEQQNGFDSDTILDLEGGWNSEMNYEKNYEVQIGGNEYSRDKFWTHLNTWEDLNIDSSDAIEEVKDENGNVTSWKFTSKYDAEVKEICARYQFTFGYTYTKINDIPFVFTTIFGAIDNDVELNTTLYSKSGSIFEVTGTAVIPETDEIKDKEGWITKAIGAYYTGLITVAAVVLMIFTCGASSAIMGLIGVALGVVAMFSGKATFNLATAAIDNATYQAEAHFSSIEDSSLGYLASSYGREIGWENGKLDAYYDSYLEISVDKYDITITNTNPTLSEYEQYINDEVLSVTVKGNTLSCKLPVSYFNCTTSRFIPQDIDATTTIEIKNGTGVQAVLYKYGIRQIEVPKYYKVDNELYCCASPEEMGKILHANYQDVIAMTGTSGFDYTDDDIINYGGYAYILQEAAEAVNYSGVIPESHTEYLLSNYKMNRVIERNVMHYITTDPVGKKLDSDEKDALRWREVDVNEDLSKSIISKTFKCYGIEEPKSGYITRPISRIDGKTLYYKDGDKLNKAITLSNDVNTSNLEIGDTLYFTLDGTGEDLTVVLRPFTSGNEGLTATEMGITGDLYYVIDKNDGYISLPRTFILSSLTGNVIDAERSKFEGDYIYTLEPVSEEEMKITYKLHNWNGGVEELTLSEIANNFSDFEGFYIEYKSQRVLVSNVFEVQDGKLYIKNLETTYLRETVEFDGDTVQYYYQPEYSDLGGSSYANRYVYNYQLNDGTWVKFYSRFYYGIDSEFFDTKVGESERLISNCLLPTLGTERETKDIVFAESARVSLSAKGVTIWKDYKQNKSITLTSGSISCYSETII